MKRSWPGLPPRCSNRVGVRWSGSTAWRLFDATLLQWILDEIEFALIDVTLGDGSGLDAATLVREKRPDLPVILVSGYDAQNVLEDQRLGDSVEFLSKPFSRGTLQASIDKVVSFAKQPGSRSAD